MNLPEFKNSPLVEVILGVQFTPPPNYSPIHLHRIRELFSEEYPNLEEHPPLDTRIETFGISAQASSQLHIEIAPAPKHSRFWFIADSDDRLIQFQENQFLLNWRKRSTGADYPRFTHMIHSFAEYLGKLEKFFEDNFSCKLDCNQAEITYINLVNVNDYSEIEDWFTVLKNIGAHVESLLTVLNEVITNVDGIPYARLNQRISSVLVETNKSKAFQYELTYRGSTSKNNVEETIKFLEEGRRKLISQFCETTTETAHFTWRRQQ